MALVHMTQGRPSVSVGLVLLGSTRGQYPCFQSMRIPVLPRARRKDSKRVFVVRGIVDRCSHPNRSCSAATGSASVSLPLSVVPATLFDAFSLRAAPSITVGTVCSTEGSLVTFLVMPPMFSTATPPQYPWFRMSVRTTCCNQDGLTRFGPGFSSSASLM